MALKEGDTQRAINALHVIRAALPETQKEAGWQLVELGTDCLALFTVASRYHESSETNELLLGMYARLARVSAAVLTAGPALGTHAVKQHSQVADNDNHDNGQRQHL